METDGSSSGGGGGGSTMLGMMLADFKPTSTARRPRQKINELKKQGR